MNTMNWPLWWKRCGRKAVEGVVAMFIARYVPAEVVSLFPLQEAGVVVAGMIGVDRGLNFLKHKLGVNIPG